MNDNASFVNRSWAYWARSLETRVEEQVRELEQLGRLRRFLSPQVAEFILSSGDEALLEDRPCLHRPHPTPS